MINNDHTWNAEEWKLKFKEVSSSGVGFSGLRAIVFQDTLNVVNLGQYSINGQNIVLGGNDELIEGTVFYESPPVSIAPSIGETDISIVNTDCLLAAAELLVQSFIPAVLNMANRHNPGGGVINGAGAQEENIFRRSNLFVSLYQFADYCDKYSIPANRFHKYPLNKDTGGVYSPGVTVFRGTEEDGYSYLQNPYKVSMITVPAISNPDLEKLNSGEYRIAERLIGPSKQKIRTILRIALAHNHDSLVLGAFGCGAFRNPPKHMAELFKSVLSEEEFRNRFRRIVFAIIEDHNSRREHNPDGNLKPFREVFG